MKKQTTITIFRTISLDCLESFDAENAGCHWGRINTRFNGGGENGLTPKRKYTLWLCAKVTADQINQAATEMSNREHPEEKEVVLNENTTIEVSAHPTEGDRRIWGLRKEIMTINTGTRVDSWVKNLR